MLSVAISQKSLISTAPPPPPPSGSSSLFGPAACENNADPRSALLKQIKAENFKLREAKDRHVLTTTGKVGSNKDKQKNDFFNDLQNTLKNLRRGIDGEQENNVQQPITQGIFAAMSCKIPKLQNCSDSVSNSGSGKGGQSYGDGNNNDWETDSNYENKTGFSKTKAEKWGALSHKRSASFPATQVNSVNPVSNVAQDRPALPLKDRIALFDQKTYRGQFQACM